MNPENFIGNPNMDFTYESLENNTCKLTVCGRGVLIEKVGVGSECLRYQEMIYIHEQQTRSNIITRLISKLFY